MDDFDPTAWPLERDDDVYYIQLSNRVDCYCSLYRIDYEWAKEYLWCHSYSRITKTYALKDTEEIYARRSVKIEGFLPNGRPRYGNLWLHRAICKKIYGPAPGPDYVCDHLDGNSLNNCRNNLRWATKLENAQNRLGSVLRKYFMNRMSLDVGSSVCYSTDAVKEGNVMVAGVERDKIFLDAVNNGSLKVKKDGTIINTKTGKQLAAQSQMVSFSLNGALHSITKNRAIWIAFNGLLPSEEHVVSFKEGNVSHLDNLKVQTRFESNSSLGKKQALHLNSKNAEKLGDDLVLSIRREFRNNPRDFKMRRRAKEVNVSHATLSFAIYGKTYKHVPEALTHEEVASIISSLPPPTKKIKKRYPKKDRKDVTAKIIKFPSKPKPVKPSKEEVEQQKQDRLDLIKKIAAKRYKS